MSASNERQAVDVASGPGISAQVADAARNEVLAATTKPPDGKPFTFVSHGTQTRLASNEYLQQGDKTEIARILGIPASDVRKRFIGSQPGFANTSPRVVTVKPGRTDYVYTILALGDLSYDDGLPALGNPKVEYRLKSGECLHFMGDLEQTYSGTGGGTIIWFHWNNLQ